METLILLVTVGCVVELMAIAIVVGMMARGADGRKRVATFCRQEIIALSIGFLFLFAGDIAFLFGNTWLIGWPWRPLIFRALCFAIFARCLARITRGR